MSPPYLARHWEALGRPFGRVLISFPCSPASYFRFDERRLTLQQWLLYAFNLYFSLPTFNQSSIFS